MLPRIIPKVCPNFRQGTVTISTLAIFINIKLGVAPRIQFESRRSPLVRSPRELIKTLDRFSKIESLPCFYFIRSCVTLRSNKIVLCSLVSKIFFFSLILSVQVSNHSRHNIVFNFDRWKFGFFALLLAQIPMFIDVAGRRGKKERISARILAGTSAQIQPPGRES